MNKEHEPFEAVGGYIECTCGWPTREQYAAGERYADHILAGLIAELRVIHQAAEPRGNVPGLECAGCGDSWPCDTAILLDHYGTELQ